MILGKKSPPGEDPYYFGKVDGVEKKFRRVVVGLILPMLDRQEGAAVAIGEKFSISGVQDFTGLGCAIGPWPEIERSLMEYDKQLQFSDAIAPTDPERKLLYRIPMSMTVRTWYAPPWALTEVGRQKTNQCGVEGRLHLDAIETDMRHDPDVSTKALHVAIAYLLDWNPPYQIRKPRPQQSTPLGIKGL